MKHWMIVYGEHVKAAEKLAAAILPYVEYVPVCAKEADDTYNTLTLHVNAALKGVHIEVGACEGECQSVLIEGCDEANLLYAVSDFKNIYLPQARDAKCHQPVYYFNELFSKPLMPYSYESAAKIDRRGIWLWGYTIYDYHRFIDNMVSLKLNTLIIWNDYPPINIADVIAYAHENHVKIYLGFAWGWDTKMPKVITPEYCDKVAADVQEIYRTQYAELGCDGMYFQSFTENMPADVGGVSVIEAVVGLVNRVSKTLYDAYGDLDILFGLHASCALPRLDKLKALDDRISVIWEDVGAFPYHYMPHKIEDFEETLEHTKQIRDLRAGGFGAVLKGVTCLDWSTFKHHRGSFALGTADRRYIEQRTAQKRDFLRYVQAGWLKNADYARRLIAELPQSAMITCLVEDGMFEEKINLPTALYAAMLWDSERPTDEILFEVASRTDVDFV